MQWLEQGFDLLSRAVYLLALSTTPSWLSPEPGSFAWPSRALLVLSFTIVLYLALRLRRRVQGRFTSLGLWLLGTAALVSLVVVVNQRGAGVPLGEGVLYVAPPLWLAIAALLTGAATPHPAARRLWARRWMPVLLLLFGALSIVRAPWLRSPQESWLEVLRRDPAATFAMDALLREPLRKDALADAEELVERCFAVAPDGCACRAGRAEVAMRSRKGGALAHARAASEGCPHHLDLRALMAEALVLEGEAEWAEQEARAALARGETPRLQRALAMALDRRGQPLEAIEAAQRAIALGAGREGVLLLGALLVGVGDSDNATKALSSLVAADPGDSAALYNLALIADKSGDYNRARQGYLSALRANPSLASARYNLAVLAYRHGVLEEARHHARSFAEAFPEDPRGATLLRLVALTK